MKLVLTALLVSTIAHADPHVTAIGDAKFAKETKSGWSLVVTHGDLAKPAPLGVLVQLAPATGISGSFASEVHGMIVRGEPRLSGVSKTLPPGSSFSFDAKSMNSFMCAPSEPAPCLFSLELANGWEYRDGPEITPKKIKVKDIVQPATIQK